MALSGQGALGGAAAGAAAGSVAGPYGAAIGGVIGGVAGAFSGAGKPTYDPYSSQYAGTSYNLFQQGQGIAYPAQNELVNYALDPNAANTAAQSAIGDVNTQFENQDTARQRMYALMGVQPTEAQQGALGKQEALSKAQAQAGAANAARQGTIQTQQGILG